MIIQPYKEYGGFLPFDIGKGELYHTNALYLNSARNALRHLIQAYGIKKISLPYFTCPVIWEVVKNENCDITFFDLDENLQPDLQKVDPAGYIVCNDYFGIQNDKINKLVTEYPSIIVDNAQAFFSVERGFASFYSPRKFFGLPDGGLLIGDNVHYNDCERFSKDTSWDRCEHLLKRVDIGATAAYADFCAADKAISQLPIKSMSNLSLGLLSGVNYEFVQRRRRENYALLDSLLSKINLLDARLPTNAVPMVYPLLVDNPGLRKKLIDRRVFVATYWPNIEEICPSGSNALYFRDHIIPLPIDQRYGSKDMQNIIDILYEVV